MLIHAARRWEADCASLLDVEPFAEALEAAALPLGCVIGCVDVVDCLPVAQVCLPGQTCHDDHRLAIGPDEVAFGNYAPGRFIWVLANAREFRVPFAYRGGQQLFDIPQKEFPLGLFEGG